MSLPLVISLIGGVVTYLVLKKLGAFDPRKFAEGEFMRRYGFRAPSQLTVKEIEFLNRVHYTLRKGRYTKKPSKNS